ncbi:MAG: ABC transporter ATP-binding protein [Phyllobacterium sp.]
MSFTTLHQGPAIEVENLSHAYGEKIALDNVSLRIERGASFALLGPNGAGKTTLLNILCTLLHFDSGRALVAGADVLRQPMAARRSIGVVFQDSSLDDRLTADENLEFHGLVYGMAKKERRVAIDAVLELVELTEWRDAIVRSFSGGMRRRLEIARALMHRPSILLLDEPTVGLDAQTRQRIWHYLRDMQTSEGLTVLTTTHYIEEVESADHVCIIDHGRILAEGSPRALKEEHGKSWLHLTPLDDDVLTTIRARFPAIQSLGHNRYAIEVNDTAVINDFLSDFADGLEEARLDAPSLESVFLSLTGRELRDKASGSRIAEQQAGRRAGRR